MNMNPTIYLIAHNIRSAHNIGSLLRTAEGLGVNKIYLTGYSPYPLTDNDNRLPHLSAKVAKAIDKTSLGSHESINWSYEEDVENLINKLKLKGIVIIGLEQSKKSIKLHDHKTPKNLALLLGNEVTGIDEQLLRLCDEIIEIPMLGKKESFNVVQAAAMTLYKFRYLS